MDVIVTCTDILDEKMNYELILRYRDRYYIRYIMDDGFVAEIPVAEIPTGKDVVKIIKENPSKMISIVNAFRDKLCWTQYSYIQSTITDYLLYSGDMPMNQASRLFKKLSKYEDILNQMYNMIVEGAPGIRKVTSQGYSAKEIMDKTSLNLIGAYLYMVSLRDDAENARRTLEEMIMSNISVEEYI